MSLGILGRQKLFKTIVSCFKGCKFEEEKNNKKNLYQGPGGGTRFSHKSNFDPFFKCEKNIFPEWLSCFFWPSSHPHVLYAKESTALLCWWPHCEDYHSPSHHFLGFMCVTYLGWVHNPPLGMFVIILMLEGKLKMATYNPINQNKDKNKLRLKLCQSQVQFSLR